jgi:flagellar motility protein MotE (MotC chaperone)
MTKLLTPTWMTLPVCVVVYAASTFLFWKTPKPAPRPIAVSVPVAAVHNNDLSQYQNPEADQLVAELKEERKRLDDREQQLNALSARLDAERGEMSNAATSVQSLQTEFDQNVLRIKEEETANLKKLAKVYSAMTPESAALILADLDDTQVAKIMVFMKEDDAAAVFEAMAKKNDAAAKRAADLSERLRVAAFRNNPPPQ